MKTEVESVQGEKFYCCSSINERLVRFYELMKLYRKDNSLSYLVTAFIQVFVFTSCVVILFEIVLCACACSSLCCSKIEGE